MISYVPKGIFFISYVPSLSADNEIPKGLTIMLTAGTGSLAWVIFPCMFPFCAKKG